MNDSILRRARAWSVANLAATLALIAWNFVAGSGRAFERTVAEVSDRYDTSFTPAGYAFAIWGLIYLSLIGMGVFQLKRAFLDGAEKPHRVESILSMSPYFFTAQLVCGCWLWAWLTDHILWSFVLMTALWALLFAVVVRWNMERYDAPWSVIIGEWWPMDWYTGWITIAWFANLGALLRSLGIQFVTQPGWAYLLAAVLVVVELALVFSRNLREFSLVAVWALVALAVRHWDTAEQGISVAALGGALVLLAGSGYHAAKNFTWPPREA